MNLDRSRPPEPGPARPLPTPTRVVRRLGNGLDLLYVHRETLPDALLALVIPAGSSSVGVERSGLASLVARVLPEGARGRSSREMAEWLDGLGVRLDVSTGYDSTVLRIHTLTESLDPALDALSAVALEPDFPEAEVERCRGERVDAIRRARDEPAEVAADLLAESVFGDHPYGRLSRGREAAVEGFTRPDLEGFHREKFDPLTATLVACGRLPSDFETRVARRFDRWAGEGTPSGPPADIVRVASPGLVLVDRPGSRQSEVRIGGVALKRGDPEEPALRMANAILGGLFNSRLNLNLREEKGWTYGARSSLSLRRAPGSIVVRAAVETKVTAAAVREMLDEVARMRDAAPTGAELRTAAGALTRSLPLRFETGAQIVSRITEETVYGLTSDYWEQFSARIEAVTGARVRDVCQRLLDPAALSVVVVGDVAEIRPDLEKLGPVRTGRAP